MNIDVIIPCFNRAPLLLRAINSVLNQSYQNFTLHIIDDGSTDDTQKLLSQFLNHPKVKLHQTSNGGVSRARNLGVQHSHGEWISFLDSDDEWLPQKLTKQTDFLKQNPQFEFVHSEEIWIRNGLRVNPKLKHKKGSEDIFKRSLEFCLISPSTVMMKRSLLAKYGPFEEQFEVCEDYDLWIKILAHHEVGFVPEYLTLKYGGHDDQLSTKYFAMDFWRIRSLVNLIQTNITEAQKELVQEVITRKSQILLKGYQKHHNNEKIEELQKLLRPIL
jgi:glycosyltransferase involved in cell wall biosynthesis